MASPRLMSRAFLLLVIQSVVPAKAGIHARYKLNSTSYGSLLSQGRQESIFIKIMQRPLLVILPDNHLRHSLHHLIDGLHAGLHQVLEGTLGLCSLFGQLIDP